MSIYRKGGPLPLRARLARVAMRRAAPLHRLPSLSGACRRLCAPAGELTRLQRFKDHIYALHTSDPSQWTDRALSRQFGVPLGRMQALLALQRLEELEGPVDEEAEALAEEVEQLLTPENLASSANARRLAALDGALQQSMPNVSMLRMSDQQEDALVGELAVRLGVASLDEPDALERVDAAISGVLDSLTPKQRAELVAVINGDFATDGEGRADGTAAASVGEAADVGAHASQGRETSAAWSAPDTPWPEALSQHPGGLLGMLIVDASQAMANDAGVLSPVVESAEELDTGVINAGVTAENPRGIPKFLVKPDLGPQLEVQ